MTSIENNNEDWKEMRARVDSIANVIFLIGGGALSLSLTVILSNLNKLEISKPDIQLIEYAWVLLLFSIIFALFLKIFIVLQTFLLQSHTEFMNRHHMKFNLSGWIIGMTSFLFFCTGLYFMVLSASNILLLNKP